MIAFSFVRGGAAKAAYRFFSIAKEFSIVNLVSVEGSVLSKYFWHFFKRLISYSLTFHLSRATGVKCSINLFSFGPALEALYKDSSSILNFHWINNDTISVFRLKDLPYGSVLTLHDEWLYCSLEHCTDIGGGFNESPYSVHSSTNSKCYLGYFRHFFWNIKKNAFSGRDDLVVTCPSTWLAQRARSSHVLKDCDVRLLPNPIDTSIFVPMDARENKVVGGSLKIGDRFLVIFGALGGKRNSLKGFDELNKAFQLLSENAELKEKIVIGLFGGRKTGIKEIHGFPVHEFGHIRSECDMAAIYSLAHVTVVPSKIESFGQVAAESQSCETPTIAFETSGLKDVVIDGKTGFLAEPFSPASLAEKIELIVSLSAEQYKKLCKRARQHVVEKFSNDVVAKQYEFIINEQFMKKKEAGL